ncbi:MAG TPA: HD domain-containing phosphohydrolase [Jatrophihabitans sp.]|jgi:FixJ family two-component response regulator|nr:HD domain-containing phosphohydrolase [Jatrophihabitans sp.]
MADRRPRVMFVDDEVNVLEALARLVRGYVQAELVESPIEAAQLLERSVQDGSDGSGGYAALVSDMRMPGMDGAALLKHASDVSPDTTRLLLTGYADMNSAIAAVNEGNIFRFLTKPASAADLKNAITAALDQHQLIVDRRVLLDQTLRGAVEALVETLAMAEPVAFARAARLRRLTAGVTEQLRLPDAWEVEVAAQLGEIGMVTLPERALEALSSGVRVDRTISEMLDRLPQLADDVLSRIPRLEGVRDIVREQRPANGPFGARSEVSAAGRVLQAVREYDAAVARGLTAPDAMELLRARPHHDVQVLDALQNVTSVADGTAVREVDPASLWAGAVLAADVRSNRGVLLVSRGEPLTDQMLVRLRNYAALSGLEARPVVFVPE